MIFTVRAVIIDAGAVLLVQHAHKQPEHVGTWGLPGGRPDPTDTDWAATLARELTEEFGVAAQVGARVGSWRSYLSAGEREHHIYCARFAHHNFTIDPNEILGYGWYTPQQMNDLPLTLGFEAEAVRQALALETPE